MKKPLLLALALAGTMTATCGFSQGTINFANSGTTLVTTNDGEGHIGTAGLTTSTGIKLQLWYQPDPAGSTAPTPIDPYHTIPANWLPIATLANISPLAGRFSAGPVTTGNTVAPGGNVWLQVIGWSGNYPSFAAALSHLETNPYFAFSPVWSQGTGDGGAVAAVPITSPTGGFTGLELYNPYSPEPSTMAIGALGTAVLLLFRRRKQ